MLVNYYEILGIEEDADSESIKKAYKKLAKKFHPDLNPDDIESSEERFKQINEAYEVLSEPSKRKLYDSYGSRWKQAEKANAAPLVDLKATNALALKYVSLELLKKYAGTIL